MGDTAIEYVDKSWNPLAMRCTRVSPGCDHCWHLRMCKRHAANAHFPYEVREAYAGGEPVMCEKILREPLGWRTVKRVAVQFMGDLFHESVGLFPVARIFCIMRHAALHQFYVLTKRPEIMAEYIKPRTRGGLPILPNVILGTTVEDQERADERLPHLMKLARMGWRTWVSVEPMLERMELTPWLPDGPGQNLGDIHHRGLDWVIVGGETGPGARPMHPDWVRDVRDQCVAAGVPFFFKGWGDWAPAANGHAPDCWKIGSFQPDGSFRRDSWIGSASDCMARVGKKRAGRLLDGVEHNELPGKE